MATSYKIRDSVLVVEIAGVWSLAAEKEVTETAVGLMSSESLTRLLLDFRKASESAETSATMHIYEATMELTENYPRGAKIAIVYSADTDKPDDVRFFENVAFNRGILARAFSDSEAATEWLR